MDPISITTATATITKLVYSASNTLYSFINEAQNVDQSVKDLATEVDGLQRTLVEVESVFKQPQITSAEKYIFTDDSKQLWNTLNGCLEECQVTVVRLNSVLDGFRNRASTIWRKQALTQVKLNLRTDEINSLRIQIHTHCITLSTALQLVNIRATYLVPGVVVGGLGPRIDTLQKSLDLMMTSIQDLKNNASRAPATIAHSESSNTQKLHSIGQRILVEATTVYESSVGLGSVCDYQVTNETILRTMNWIPEPSRRKPIPSTNSATPTRGYPPTPSTTNSVVDTQKSRRDENLDEVKLLDSDSETEFEFEMMEGLLKKGRDLFESQDYTKSSRYLEKGIAAFNKLPHNHKARLDPVEIPLMIATCKYHLGEIDEASKDLLLLVQKESSGDKDAIRKCQISYLLSQIYLIKENFQAAEHHCRNSLKGRRRLLGRSHRDYFSSISLLSEIYIAVDKHEESVVLKDMLPPEHQHNADIKRLRDLTGNREISHRSAEDASKKEASYHGSNWMEGPPQQVKHRCPSPPIGPRPSYSADLSHHSTSSLKEFLLHLPSTAQ